MVSKILRQTVYVPVRSISTRFLGRNMALYPAILATFFVSGIMHETLLYHVARVKSRRSWEMTCYFLIHGVCLDLEIGLKRALKGKFSLPPTVSRLLTMAFVFTTSLWLFVPPCLRAKLDVRACTESLAFIEFVKHQRLVNPAHFTCPF